jgi:fructose/tagatose bisphosphate aldolase
MPIASYEQYCKMLESAYKNKYAYPAINIASIEAANAALAGFVDAKSDGIIQVSIGGGEHASGQMIKDSVLGAISLANHVHLLAERYNVFIALHTDHCRPDSKYMVATTFGNVHGVYKSGSVKLMPIILKQGQDAIKKKYGKDAGLYPVFHGGSGSSEEEIQETLEYVVVKMNIDTDTQ